jgi:phage baseplate assembly protein W
MSLKTDLLLTRSNPNYSDRLSVDIQASRGDLKLVTDRDNLAQAIINRLLTHQGELSELGHPDYGSRLNQLIGQPNNRRTQALAELYIRESLAAESRIKEITHIEFMTPQKHQLKFIIIILPVDNQEPLNISMDINLEG